jgi:hypothetical protein
MMPHEQLLVNRLRDEPFALLGINLDRDRDEARALDARLGNNWRSWWDPDLKIAKRWDIDLLPSIFIIDHRGVIRFEHAGYVDDEVLDRTIDDLVRQAKQTGT